MIETFLWVFSSQKGKTIHYDNHIVGNITVVINQWKHLSNGFWKQYQRHYYLNWLNKRKTRYVKTNKYQECIWISNNPNMEIWVNRFRITYNWKWRALGFGFALYGKIGCCDLTSIDGFEMTLHCRFWLLIESLVGILVHCLLQPLLLLLLLLLQIFFSPTIYSLILDYHSR